MLNFNYFQTTNNTDNKQFVSCTALMGKRRHYSKNQGRFMIEWNEEQREPAAALTKRSQSIDFTTKTDEGEQFYCLSFLCEGLSPRSQPSELLTS